MQMCNFRGAFGPGSEVMKRLLLYLLFSLLLGAELFAGGNSEGNTPALDGVDSETIEEYPAVPFSLAADFSTDFTQVSVDLGRVVSGGPGKNGIPALFDPKFISISESSIPDDVQAIVVTADGGGVVGGETRVYPLNILVWHELINDTIGELPILVSFCPLCGSALVFNRTIKSSSEVLDFRVSGWLMDSNMILYDTLTESLWNQSLGRGIAGMFNEIDLTLLPFTMQRMGIIRDQYPHALVVSEDTGYLRDYRRYPYGNYESSDNLFFPVSTIDDRYPRKELFYIIPYKDYSIALQLESLVTGVDYLFADEDFTFTLTWENEVFTITDESEEIMHGYYEMWFSWSVQHQGDGIVWNIN